MASAYDKLKELDLTRDEVERIGEALKKEEFRKLLREYVEEVQDPANKKLYQEEITQLEKERGVDVTFVDPEPGYVIKTSVDGAKKCFVNVCVNDHIARPSSAPGRRDGDRGLQWSLPHSLAPGREDVDNKGARCAVYDVVFHPDALRLARANKAFLRMLNETVCDAVEANFDVRLDRKNLRFPKLRYKGLAHAAVIRRPSPGFAPPEMDAAEKEFFDKIYPPQSAKPPKKSPRKCEEKTGAYATPKYVIKHRSHVDLQECLEEKHARQHAAVPRELVVEVELPLLRSAADITLDVAEKTVQLVSERPAKYRLDLTLPYRVNEASGSAKFDKDLKRLVVALPVKRVDYARDDSGVESDHGPTTPDSEEEVFVESGHRSSFLEECCGYQLPEFTCHLFERTLAFTLHVKNVDEASVRKLTEESALHVKFASVSASYYTSYHAFFVRLPVRIVEAGVQVEVWDNNVVVQVPCEDAALTHYFYGLRDGELKRRFLEEPAVLDGVLQNAIPEEPEPVAASGGEETERRGDKAPEKSTAISIAGSCYESSGDELSCSYSPSRSKGILKRLSNSRRLVGRSVSESSLDDMVCSSVDSAIPEDRAEEGEISTSLKKTVRFNDVIMRQLYRSNSSILGQKKKNQRKARNKKRAQERRHSESEASEIEDKKDDEGKSEENDNEKDESTSGSKDEKSDYITSDIFDMDMNF